MELFNKTLSLMKLKKRSFNDLDEYNINKILFVKDNSPVFTSHKPNKRLPSIDIDDIIVPQTNKLKNEMLIGEIDSMIIETSNSGTLNSFEFDKENIPPDYIFKISEKPANFPNVDNNTALTNRRLHGKIPLKNTRFLNFKQMRSEEAIKIAVDSK